MRRVSILIAIFCCFLFPLTVEAYDYGIENYYVEATMLENGDLHVKELFTMNGSYNGFERIIHYENENATSFDANATMYGGSTIHNGDNLEIIKVQGIKKKSLNGADFSVAGTEFEKVSTAQKGNYGVYTMGFLFDSSYRNPIGLSLMIFNPSSKQETFYIEYIIKNIAIAHEDVAELGWTFIGSQLYESIRHLELILNIPGNQSELRGWAHGPLNGDIELVSKDQIKVSVDYLGAYTAIDVRAAFDLSVISSSMKQTGVSALDKIVAYETELATQANLEREELNRQNEIYAIGLVEIAERTLKKDDYELAHYYTSCLMSGDVKTDLLTRLELVEEQILDKEANYIFFANVTSVILILSLGVLIYVLYHKYDKEHKTEFNSKYYRDLPASYAPSTVGYLLHRKVSANDLSANILSLIERKLIVFEEIGKNDYLFKKGTIPADISYANSKLLQFLFDKKQEIKLSDLKRRAKSSYTNFIIDYEAWTTAAQIDGIQEDFYEIGDRQTAQQNSSKTIIPFMLFIPIFFGTTNILLGVAFAFVALIVGYVLSMFNKNQNKYLVKGLSVLFCLLTLATGIYFVFTASILTRTENSYVLYTLLSLLSLGAFIYFVSFTKKTQKGIDHYKKWVALKNFMVDFGRMDEKELPEIHLWEKYLVYAVSLGCADKLSRDMKIRVDQLNQLNTVDTTIFDYYMFRNMMIMNRMMNQAVASSVSRAYSSRTAASSGNSSSGFGGGGGFSGGGGSFGGGGGGGRF